VWSLSYGEELQMKSVSYVHAVDTIFQALATRGVSVLVASGDTGAYSRQNPLDFAAEFPAALPSCTAVGATILNPNLTETSTVTCDFGWCSGGGLTQPSYFANTSAPWQIAAVNAYLKQPGLPPTKDWSKFVGGVGFPDVATIGTNHEIYCKQKLTLFFFF
jgi:subtilase family serine protease